MIKKKKSLTRFQAREAEKKIVPAIRLLSQYMHNTAHDVPTKDFHGYSVSSGYFVDKFGKKWQLQVRAVCTKQEFVKDQQINPIIRKGAWMFKLRLFSKAVIDKIFS